MTVTPLEPPWEVHTPRGKADALLFIDYAQESYGYFLMAARGTGEFWIYRNDKVQLAWNETTGVGRRPDDDRPEKYDPINQENDLPPPESYGAACSGTRVVNSYGDWLSLPKETMADAITQALRLAYSRGYVFGRNESSAPDETPKAEAFIPLTEHEIQSGLDRVRWAELLITQLPAHHDGRNSWLLNYARKPKDAHGT